jgi:hypothetical protein
MVFLLKWRDGRDLAKKRYCPVQNGTYGQPTYRPLFLAQSGT